MYSKQRPLCGAAPQSHHHIPIIDPIVPRSSFSTSSSSFNGGGHFFSTSDDPRLLCSDEDAGSFSDDTDGDDSQKRARDDGDDDDDEVVVMSMWVDVEGDYSPGLDYRSMFLAPRRSGSIDPLSRHHSVAWILKVGAYFGFRPLTVYLAVNYMDRFLSSNALLPPQTSDGWPLQLLSVACLSLAAKMEETIVPSLLDLQVEDARFIFEPRTVQRMELLVLTALNWRLRSITPFAFIDFFAGKVDPARRTCTGYLVSRATQIILTTTPEVDFLGYRPSSMAAAAVVCAAGETPVCSFIDPGSAASWCAGLTMEGIKSCYQRMREHVVDSRQKKTAGRLRIPSHLRITTTTTSSVSTGSHEILSSSSSSSSSSSTNNKRRKLNNCLWVDDDKNSPLKEDDD